MRVQFILSDISNVLVRTKRFDIEEQLAKRYELDQEEVRRVIYVEGECMRALECGNLSWGAYRDASLKRLSRMGARLTEDAPLHFASVWRDHWQEPILPVVRLWTGMRQHFRIVSASNIDVQSYETGVAIHPMVAHLFHDPTHSYELRRRKGEADYFDKLLSQLGAKPEECFFVDDLAKHVAAAQAHGIASFCLEALDTATLGRLKAQLVEAGVPPKFVMGSNFDSARG